MVDVPPGASGDGPSNGALWPHHLTQLVGAEPDSAWIMDIHGEIVVANAALATLVGRDPAQDSQHVTTLVAADDHARVEEELRRTCAGEVRRFEAHGVAADGQHYVVEVTNVPVFDTDGAVEVIVSTARDITADLAAQSALETSEERFRGLFEGTGVGMFIADLERRIVDANPALLAMFGYTREELLGRDVLDLTHPDERAAAEGRNARLVSGETSGYTVDKRYVRADGATLWGRTNVSRILDPGGDPTHVAVTVEDVTRIRSVSDRLARSEKLRRLAGDLARVGGWSVEADTNQVYWSEEVFRILEAPEGDEPSLEECLALYPPDDRVRIETAIGQCLADGTPFTMDMAIDTFAGRRIHVRSIGEPETIDGRIARVIGAFQDISDIRAAATAAEEAGRRHTQTLETMTDALFTVDQQWRFTYLNPRAEVLLQRTADELLGKNVWEEFPAAVGGALYETYHRAVATGTTLEVEDYYAPLDTWFAVHAYPTDQGLTVYFRNVNEKRAAREALKQQAMLLDLAQDAILVRDLHNRIIFWNRSAERLYGWSNDEAVGADIRAMLYDDPQKFDVATAHVTEHGTWVGELRQRTKDGAAITVNCRWTCVRDDEGAPSAVLAINTDVTEQRRTEQQLLRAQRLESIGTLAGGVAHDLNNVLAPILLAADLMRSFELENDLNELLDTISTSAQRGADLISQVLSFARGVEGERAPVDLTAMITSIHAMARDTFPKNIALVLDVVDDVPTIIGDTTQIQQVLLNLAVNGRDAMPDGGTLTVRVSTIELDAQFVAATPGSTIGDYVLVEVEDDGVGMRPDVRDRVFEPFFTTKPHGSGTGLGLSTAAAIVRSHGGFIRVYSDLGRGTRFAVYLPRNIEPSDPQGVPTSATDAPRGSGELILVVDDEAAVRAMTRQTLEVNGYRVLEAGDGAEAVSVFAEHRDDVVLVLTDMMLPVMDGPATILALRRLVPDLPIIGSSGLQANGRAGGASQAGVEYFLPKPYSSRTLLEMVHRVLRDVPRSAAAADDGTGDASG